MWFLRSIVAAITLLNLAPAFASEQLTKELRRIFDTKQLQAKTFGPARWIDGGTAYTTVENKEIIRYETATGKRTVIVSSTTLADHDISDYHWSDDSKQLLVFTNTKKVWRDNTSGDYWILNMSTGSLKQVGAGAPASSLMFAKFSPDGRHVAYVRANNIYAEDIGTGKTTALTANGSATLINGTSDWVYEEELSLRDCWRWSPDSRAIAYWQFDSTGVQNFTLLNNTDTLYPKPTLIPYPKVGTTNSAARIGVVQATGGDTQWMQIPGDPRDNYLFRMEWAGNSGELVIGQLNRLQNHLSVYLAQAANGKATTFFEDKDDAWVDVRVGGFDWVDHGKQLLWVSERDGWRHAYLAPRSGAAPRLITKAASDITAVDRMDPDTKWLYYMASPENATQNYLYRVSAASGTDAVRLTPQNQPGTHSYNIAPDCKWAFHTYSSFDRVPVTDLISLPDHRSVRVLEDNAALRTNVSGMLTPPIEFLKVRLADGTEMDGYILKPVNFDPSKKYPLIVHVYGEPAATTVVDRWSGRNEFFHRALANEGYLIASFDNRGTPAPKGRAWRKIIYGSVGDLSSKDQAEALRKLISERSYIDGDRIGVWGWSGGGTNTLNLMFRSPELYKVGVAVASVPDQRLYDTIYQERYMGLPDQNENGYHRGSAINFAEGLRGKLLIVHGSGDDNVHFQGTERLVNRLIELGKPFDFMEYPNRTHAISEGKGTSLHIYQLIARYFEEHLPAGGR
jgi:dipeptidyl-peptidase-4